MNQGVEYSTCDGNAQTVIQERPKKIQLGNKKDKKEDKKVKEEEDNEQTMTGKPAAKIEVNPKSKEDK